MISVAVGIAVVGLLGSGTPLAVNDAPPSPAIVPPPSEAAAPKLECFPECRAGFLCHEGQCISRCNPPCPTGTECTNESTCVNTAPPAQTTAPAPAAPAPIPAPPATSEIGSHAAVPESRPRSHHGFFLRLALGVGYLRDTSTYEGTIAELVNEHGSVDRDGIAQVGELSMGGTPLPGLVIGGGIYDMNAWGDSQTVNSSLIGPFAAYYFRPSGGLHVMAAPCLSITHTSRDVLQFSSSNTGAGWGVVGGAGYDAFVSSSWSLGALLRLQYTTVNDDESSSRSLFVPSLLFTATYY